MKQVRRRQLIIAAMTHINRRRAVIEKIITVRNRAGIHARPAALISQTANKFKSEILMQKDTLTINAKSIMGVITMAAGYNTNLIIRADGEDEAEAVEALRSLFENKFEEE